MRHDRRLNRKPTVVNPDRRLIAIHPFYVWLALRRFEVMDKLAGVDHGFRSPEDIASVLFSNWRDLTTTQQIKVIRCKLTMPIRFLDTQLSWVQQKYNQVSNPHRWERYYRPKIDKGLNIWRSRPGPFYGSLTRTFAEDDCLAYSYDSLDEQWAIWTGRKLRTDRAIRRAEKMLASYELETD